MRQWVTAILAIFGLALGAAAVTANDVEVKGPHICCGQCVNIAKKVLGKVEGVSDVVPDAKTKTVKFTAKDDKAAEAGFKALVDAGFFGAATNNGTEIKIGVTAPKAGDKMDVVVVKDVHVCCGACQNAIVKLFDGSKVTFEGKGPQRTVRITGTALESSAVMEALRKAGFNGDWK